MKQEPYKIGKFSTAIKVEQKLKLFSRKNDKHISRIITLKHLNTEYILYYIITTKLLSKS
jgi:hypothetical protein